LRRSILFLLPFLVANFYAGSQPALECTPAGYAITRLHVALERNPTPTSAANHGMEVKEPRRMEFLRTFRKYHKANLEATHFSLEICRYHPRRGERRSCGRTVKCRIGLAANFCLSPAKYSTNHAMRLWEL